MLTKSFRAGVIGLISLAFSAWATGATLEGVVKDATGLPVKGADVRIEAATKSKVAKIVKTDSSGRYRCVDLAVGTYRVFLSLNGSLKASIMNATTSERKSTQLNFALTDRIGPTKTHMVWVAPDTGTHIGNGRWIEVDENGRVVNGANGTSATETVSGDNLKSMERNMLSGHTQVAAGGTR
jgi:Carboxypeptidase regulatory-like domain